MEEGSVKRSEWRGGDEKMLTLSISTRVCIDCSPSSLDLRLKRFDQVPFVCPSQLSSITACLDSDQLDFLFPLQSLPERFRRRRIARSVLFNLSKCVKASSRSPFRVEGDRSE